MRTKQDTIMDRQWEDYVEYRDRLEALDRLPQSKWTDGKACELIRLLRDLEELYDTDMLESRYDDPEKAESKERQIASYMRMYERELIMNPQAVNRR